MSHKTEQNTIGKGEHEVSFLFTFSMRVSLLVIFRHPSSVSCTIPMTGLFDCGETMHFGTIINSRTSALVSNDWGTCIFISSPSKSALYGEVTDKFNRKVE